jgi:DNA-binding IclR family transcriptional regulator
MSTKGSRYKAALVPGGVEAVDRAFSLLRCFEVQDDGLSLTELAARAGLHKSTALRLATSLAHAGYLIRRDDKLFVLGPEPMRLGALYARAFRLEDHVRPVLRTLLKIVGESASFYRRIGDHRICLFREHSQHAIRDHVQEGDMLPLPIGAAGKVLSEFTLGRSVRGDLDLPVLSFGERDRETAAAAVPIFSSKELVGALGVSGPRIRFTADRIAAMRPPLMRAGAALSKTLGGESSWTAVAE